MGGLAADLVALRTSSMLTRLYLPDLCLCSPLVDMESVAGVWTVVGEEVPSMADGEVNAFSLDVDSAIAKWLGSLVKSTCPKLVIPHDASS